MGIDYFFWFPAGFSNDRIGYTKYRCGECMPLDKCTRHQVFLAHGSNVLIDEQYFFQAEVDARWFWEVGYKERLYLIGEGPENYGYDRMHLWVDGNLEAERRYVAD